MEWNDSLLSLTIVVVVVGRGIGIDVHGGLLRIGMKASPAIELAQVQTVEVTQRVLRREARHMPEFHRRTSTCFFSSSSLRPP